MSTRITKTGPGLRAVLERIGLLERVTMEIGVIAASVASGPSSGPDLVTIAASNEYGTDTIPPRPFLRTAVKRNRRRWVTAIERAVPAAALRGLPGILAVHRTAGVIMVGDTQAVLRQGPWIPNAPSTIARKGSSMPLVGISGQLVQSIRALIVVQGRREVVG